MSKAQLERGARLVELLKQPSARADAGRGAGRLDLRRHQRLPRRHPGRRRAPVRDRAARVRADPARRHACRRSATPASLPEGDALADAVARLHRRRSSPRSASAAAEAGRRRRAASDAEPASAPKHVANETLRDGVATKMAGGQERILRRRIRTVQATKKITRAMELIAASRIVKAQARVQAAVPYANGITDVVRNLQAAGGGASHPMLVERPEIRRVAHVVIAADRGLCGGYNSAVIRAAEAEIRDHARARPRVRARHRRPQGRGLLPVPQLPTSPPCTRASATTRPTRTRVRSRRRSSTALRSR